MKVLFGSVIYESAMSYFPDFCLSLEKQKYKDFCLLLIDDDVNINDVREVTCKYSYKTEIIKYNKSYTPTELRIRLLKESKYMQSDYLILGDADDTFSSNRVEKSVEKLDTNLNRDFVYNKLCLEDGQEAMPELPEQVEKHSDIIERNFLGLSNTAIRLNNVDINFIDSLFECRSFVFDWYLFSRMLINGYTGARVNEAITYYRLHGNNYAGIPLMNNNSIKKEIEVKRKHYKTLAHYQDDYKELEDAYKANEIENNTDCSKYFWWNLTRRKRE